MELHESIPRTTDTQGHAQCDFLESLFVTDPSSKYMLGICKKPSFVASWFPATTVGIQAAACQGLLEGEDAYFHVTLHDQSEVNGRGNNNSSRILTCLWADIDLAEAGKVTSKNYPPREFAFNLLHDLDHPPSIIVDSGNGLHAYWLLEDHLIAQEYDQLPAAFQAHLRSALVDVGSGEAYDLDSTGDLARVLRVPGTTNSKGGRRVEIIEFFPDRRYSVVELESCCRNFQFTSPDPVEYYSCDIELDPEAEVADTKFNQLMKNAKFKASWDEKREDLQDQSPSTYDMSLASQAIQADWSDQEIVNLIVSYRRKHGHDLKLRPNYYTRTIAKARAGIEKSHDEKEKIIHELNNRHAVIHVGKTLVLTEKVDPVFNRKTFELESRTSFNDWYAPRELDGKKISNIWFLDPNRRQYDGLVFSPQGEVPKYFNMFQGFPITPGEGNCSLCLDLIKDVICNGNQKHYDYVIKWIAHLFQKPAELPGTALVMRGRQGTGKGTMMKYLGELVGQHYLELVQMGQVTGRFNAHMKDALLVHANEAIWGGDKPSEGAIKAMITDETSAIEFKGKDIITVKNYKRLVLASNNDWVVPRDMDCRRFFVLDVSDAHKEDQDYFSAIHKQMTSGGLQGLMHHLFTIDLDDFNPRIMPETGGAGFDMKLRSMNSEDEWLYELLDRGIIPPENHDISTINIPWPTEILKSKIHSMYTDWCKTQNERHPLSQTLLGRRLNEVFPSLANSRPTYSGKRVHCYKFPPLDECRRCFEQECKEGPYIWSQWGDSEN